MSTPPKSQNSLDQLSSPPAMVSTTLAAPRPNGTAGPRRPKLSLQTAPQAGASSRSAAPTTASLAIDSPTSRNTHANTRTGRPSTRSSPSSPRVNKSSNASPKTSSPLHSSASSPKTKSTPYALPLGPRPILRNSPLRGQIASPSSRGPVRLYMSSNKRVLFRDALVELMPTPLIEISDSGSDSEENVTGLSQTSKSEADESDPLQHPTPISRRKKQREWVWTIANDSPAEGKFLRGSDDKPIYPRTPGPGDEGSTSESSDTETPSQIPLPNTPGTPYSASQDPRSPSQVPLPVTPATPILRTPKTPSRIPLPPTPIDTSAKAKST